MKTISRTFEIRTIDAKVYTEKEGVHNIEFTLYDVKESEVEKEIKATLKESYPDAVYLNSYDQVSTETVTMYMTVADFIVNSHVKGEKEE